jgi:hypothetical protein
LAGEPDINIADWKSHTAVEGGGPNSRVVHWFWEFVVTHFEYPSLSSTRPLFADGFKSVTAEV